MPQRFRNGGDANLVDLVVAQTERDQLAVVVRQSAGNRLGALVSNEIRLQTVPGSGSVPHAGRAFTHISLPTLQLECTKASATALAPVLPRSFSSNTSSVTWLLPCRNALASALNHNLSGTSLNLRHRVSTRPRSHQLTVAWLSCCSRAPVCGRRPRPGANRNPVNQPWPTLELENNPQHAPKPTPVPTAHSPSACDSPARARA